MTKNDFSLDFKSAQQDFELLMNELRAEGVDENREGLVNNIEYIYSLYERDSFISLLSQGQPIGFATWRKDLNTAHIDFIWLIPSYRGKGIGRIFQELLNNTLRRKRIYVLRLDVASEYGKALADAIGFKNLCDTDYFYNDQTLRENNKFFFTKKGRTSYSVPSGVGTELIIWPTLNTTCQPSQCFIIDDNLKKNPILAIVNREAAMEIRENGNTQIKRTIKYFFKEDKELQNGYFLYLNERPLALNH